MTNPKSGVMVYKGRGVGPLSFRETLATLRSCLPGVPIRTCGPRDLCEPNHLNQTSLFVLPGGRDVPYHEDLQGAANTHLRRFVELGGTFLGICAGAYYGAARVAFETGTSHQVTGPRELAFFPGTAVGTVYRHGNFIYESEVCAHPARIQLDESSLHVYYNGGCYFEDATAYDETVTTVGLYSDVASKPLAAIVSCQVGRGKAILSGVHIDYRPGSVRGRVPNSFADLLEVSDAKRLKLVSDLLHGASET